MTCSSDMTQVRFDFNPKETVIEQKVIRHPSTNLFYRVYHDENSLFVVQFKFDRKYARWTNCFAGAHKDLVDAMVQFYQNVQLKSNAL